MASFTVRNGHRYRATLSLSGFEQFASNDMVASKLQERASSTSWSRAAAARATPKAPGAGPIQRANFDSYIVNVVEIPATPAGGAAMVAAVQPAASFTVRNGHRYRATLSLSGFEQFASNDMVASKLQGVGFSNVAVSGSGTRIAEGTWTGPDTTAQLDLHIVNVVEILAAPAGGAAMVAAVQPAASFTVCNGHRYRATLSLSGSSNSPATTWWQALQGVGFSNVAVSGSGARVSRRAPGPAPIRRRNWISTS